MRSRQPFETLLLKALHVGIFSTSGKRCCNERETYPRLFGEETVGGSQGAQLVLQVEIRQVKLVVIERRGRVENWVSAKRCQREAACNAVLEQVCKSAQAGQKRELSGSNITAFPLLLTTPRLP